MLEIKGVSKFYAGKTALNKVAFSVPKSSVFGLLGPNGAGKTSLIRIITGITGPDEGQILINSNPIGEDSIRKIGYLPEERGLYKKMEVYDQAMYFARLRGLNKSDAQKRIKYWFEKLEISSWSKKKIEELSKGMAQKVQFAITILHEPELLILDEPFTGFDPINAEAIKNEILELNKKGTTIILSTHRMESVESLCSHIALINKSNLIIEGSVEEVKSRFKRNEFICSWIGSMPNFSDSGFDLLQHSSSPQGNNLLHHAIFKANTDNFSVNYLVSKVLDAGNLVKFEEMVPEIHDIFIDLVGKDDNE